MNNMKRYSVKLEDETNIFFGVHHKGLEAAIRKAAEHGSSVHLVSGSNDEIIDLIWSSSEFEK